MKRLIESKLNDWKFTSSRKPLLIHGIRQVGKTWIVKDFGKRNFEYFVYINFDMEPSYSDIFKRTKDPIKILFELSVLLGYKIIPNKTLIFFDEIQECNEALNTLKYFEESDEEYYVIGAGSYLGITLSKGSSFPVGKVELIEMYAMTFKEFLMADNEEILVDYMDEVINVEEISEPIFNKLNDCLRRYLVVGGMPEAVKSWIVSEDFEVVTNVQQNILNAYYRDFSKYPPRSIIPKIVGIWDSIVAQLSRENSKFMYSEISKGARAREYETSLDWLIAGKYLSKVSMVNNLEIPLKAYASDKHFKLYFPDVGLLRQMANYPISIIMDKTGASNNQFIGAIMENFLLQELKALGINNCYYWNKGQYEMDYIIQFKDKILPIEVKAGVNVRSASMKKVLEDKELGVRISMRNLRLDGKVLNIPFVLVSQIGVRPYK